MVTIDTFKRGFLNGIKTLLDLLKLLVPVYIGVQLLSISGLLTKIAVIFEPVMSIFGLPGESSLVLILGWFSGTYAALGAMATTEFTVIQLTTLAIMLTIAHNLITEGAIVKKLGVSTFASVSLRIIFSLLMGFIYYRIFG